MFLVTWVGGISRSNVNSESSACQAVSVLRHEACLYRNVPVALSAGPSSKPLMCSHQTFPSELY